MNRSSDDFDFDVLLSFAGSERDYARAIYDICTANALRVFLDEELQITFAKTRRHFSRLDIRHTIYQAGSFFG